MGASRLLVRLTVRMRAWFRSSFDCEMIICCSSGSAEERALLIRAPPGGDPGRFDIVVVKKREG